MSIKLLSWNIWGGKYLSQVMDFLGKENADIIALQEVAEEKGSTTADTIAKAMGYECVYAPNVKFHEHGKVVIRGNAVLSRYPVTKHTIHVLSSEESRVAVQADIDVKGTLLHVVSVHLVHSHQQPSARQVEQVKNLLAAVPKENTVVMGDFNSLPESDTITRMRQAFHDTDPDDTPSWCLYPDGCKVCKPERVEWKLDYIFVTEDLSANNFLAGDSQGSDHLPVTLGLILP